MFDQLRFDYLSCAGHPHLQTPNIDKIAERGVRFSRCYVQSPICGSSRMSFYTGRYVSSHGAQWNGFPLKVGEHTIGDHLRKQSMSSWLVGKTHFAVDHEGMERLGIAHDGTIGARVSECGFDVFARDDGLWAMGPDGFYDSRRSPYNEYLKSQGYDGENPWHDYANSGVEDDGEIASGWFMMHASKPANIKEQDSETPWLTREVIRFIESREENDEPWMCHASYIKPHWPYIVPEPYHNMFGANHVPQAARHPAERENPHPVFGQFMNNAVGKAFHRDEVREAVIPAYMGLIKQADDSLGVLFDYLEKSGRIDDTMIVITSDHGDYLGDHWMGEKSLFHEQSSKIPMIIYDPSPEADGGRGTVCDELVESIDLAATFVEYTGGVVPDHIIEGHSLMPFLRGETPDKWRDYAISEFDYSATPMAENLELAPRDARLFMVTDKRWKFMHAEGIDSATGQPFKPILFDMENDPEEFFDVGIDKENDQVIELMYERLAEWGRRLAQRTTKSEEDIVKMRGASRSKGILVGMYDGTEVEPELTVKYRGKAERNYLGDTDPAE